MSSDVTCASASIASTTFCGVGTYLTSGCGRRGMICKAPTSIAENARPASIRCYSSRIPGGRMRKMFMTPLTSIAVIGAAVLATAMVGRAQQPKTDDIIDIEMLTHTELTAKQKAGFTSVLIVTGGTEERGPHNILGGHTIMSHRHGLEIARRLGKTMMAPVLPMAIAATGLREGTDQPGGVQLPPEVFKAVILAEIESQYFNGFKNIFVMGDHGGGQAEM